ncbi:hydrolase [Actinoplanes lobatus]|uniref:Hydrolase n=1 Tax=Actinoplanes lobatus TaxID=113568 RepID=A0A7W7HQL6_9ACTN|nr:dienelactone hydrolase family protein [Actinoplanes lobatus]MBB4754865.1 dienelactone hydrolase [Actinoplanes lobatus]GGN81411.1 hydrolase [Actinoplanes lobatus]GIE46141.1 hydrolase [Actinoplanes lobatus]
MTTWMTQERIELGSVRLDADMTLPEHATGVVLFAHGSGSSRHSPRNRVVAAELNRRRFATVLADLLTPEEEVRDARTGELRFDIGLLADRLVGIIDWMRVQPPTAALPLGLFGASTGGGAALVAAAARPSAVRAVVSRGGRPDLAGPALVEVRAPTLLIVGEHDPQVIDLNEEARNTMRIRADLRIVAGATHLFEEPGALETVAEEAGHWFGDHLVPAMAR